MIVTRLLRRSNRVAGLRVLRKIYAVCYATVIFFYLKLVFCSLEVCGFYNIEVHFLLVLILL